jgi:hypothetical protein
VTAAPATGDELDEVTRYFDAGPATVVIAELVPVMAGVMLSVAVTVWIVPATVAVVKETVAMPAAFVVDVPLANEPPVPVFDQATTRPLVATALLLASASCAVIVTAAPATGDELEDVTMYFVAVPAIVVTVPLVPVRAEPSVPVKV